MANSHVPGSCVESATDVPLGLRPTQAAAASAVKYGKGILRFVKKKTDRDVIAHDGFSVSAKMSSTIEPAG
eukprot:scaffold12_cov155-Amphora_coffeaeformis.AAC.4